jgi:hypothetical protein
VYRERQLVSAPEEVRAASGRDVGFGARGRVVAPDILYSNRKFRVSSDFRARLRCFARARMFCAHSLAHMQEKSPRHRAAGFSIVCESISA